MQEIGLFDAWQVWWSGEKLDAYTLWGRSFVWWGRAAKLLQYASALLIVAEIVGPTRLRTFGASLHGRITLRDISQSFAIGWGWLRTWWAVVRAGAHRDEETYARAALALLFAKDRLPALRRLVHPAEGKSDEASAATFERFLLSRIFWYSMLLSTAVTVLVAVTYRPEWFVLLIVWGILIEFVAPPCIVLLLWFAAGVGAVADAVVLEPLAWLLEREHLAGAVKTCSLGLLTVGVAFDMLAS